MCRVLIVDDDFGMRDHLKDVVKKWDDRLDPVVAGSEDEAVRILGDLESLQIAIVDLFLTDNWAPLYPQRGEGLQVLKKVRQAFPACFTILITSKRESFSPPPELVDYFVSFHSSNSDYRSQLEAGLQFGLAAA